MAWRRNVAAWASRRGRTDVMSDTYREDEHAGAVWVASGSRRSDEDERGAIALIRRSQRVVLLVNENFQDIPARVRIAKQEATRLCREHEVAWLVWPDIDQDGSKIVEMARCANASNLRRTKTPQRLRGAPIAGGAPAPQRTPARYAWGRAPREGSGVPADELDDPHRHRSARAASECLQRAGADREVLMIGADGLARSFSTIADGAWRAGGEEAADTVAAVTVDGQSIEVKRATMSGEYYAEMVATADDQDIDADHEARDYRRGEQLRSQGWRLVEVWQHDDSLVLALEPAQAPGAGPRRHEPHDGRECPRCEQLAADPELQGKGNERLRVMIVREQRAFEAWAELCERDERQGLTAPEVEARRERYGVWLGVAADRRAVQATLCPDVSGCARGARGNGSLGWDYICRVHNCSMGACRCPAAPTAEPAPVPSAEQAAAEQRNAALEALRRIRYAAAALVLADKRLDDHDALAYIDATYTEAFGSPRAGQVRRHVEVASARLGELGAAYASLAAPE